MYVIFFTIYIVCIIPYLNIYSYYISSGVGRNISSGGGDRNIRSGGGNTRSSGGRNIQSDCGGRNKGVLVVVGISRVVVLVERIALKGFNFCLVALTHECL